MLNLERQQQEMELIKKYKSITVKRLSEILFTSESTIRRDLTVLEKTGKLRRTFGGVILTESPENEVPLIYRKVQNINQKKAIAEKCKNYIENGNVIFLDASTSASFIVPHLAGFKDITVVTNNPLTSVALGELGIKNYCTGGLLLNNSVAYVGGFAADFVSNIYADVLFFSCRGISEDGVLSDSSYDEIYIKKAMMKNAKKKIFLCDNSKFGLTFMHHICTKDDIDLIITE